MFSYTWRKYCLALLLLCSPPMVTAGGPVMIPDKARGMPRGTNVPTNAAQEHESAQHSSTAARGPAQTTLSGEGGDELECDNLGCTNKRGFRNGTNKLRRLPFEMYFGPAYNAFLKATGLEGLEGAETWCQKQGYAPDTVGLKNCIARGGKPLQPAADRSVEQICSDYGPRSSDAYKNCLATTRATIPADEINRILGEVGERADQQMNATMVGPQEEMQRLQEQVAAAAAVSNAAGSALVQGVTQASLSQVQSAAETAAYQPASAQANQNPPSQSLATTASPVQPQPSSTPTYAAPTPAPAPPRSAPPPRGPDPCAGMALGTCAIN